MKAHEHFAASHAFHKTMADHHSGCEEDHRALAEECDGEMAKRHASLADRHAAMKAAHSEHAKHHAAMHSDATSKAAIDELEKSRNALEPSRVSAVAPPNLRAIPRTGAPSLEKAVDAEFAHLVSTDDRPE